MISKIKDLCVKYREIIVYIIVGVMTTIFCWVMCWIGEHFIFDVNNAWQNFVNNTINWILGVSFAFPLNRKWVFKSTSPNWGAELLKFASSRVSTWALDVLIMFLFVNVISFVSPIGKVTAWLGMDCTPETLEKINYWFVKIFISSVVVMVVNYVFSKLFVFRKKKTKEEGILADEKDI